MNQQKDEHWTKQDLVELAKSQKNINWVILISIGVMFVLPVIIISLAGESGIVTTIAFIASFSTLVWIQVHSVYKLAVAVRSPAAFYIILMIIPLVNLLGLLRLNDKATKMLQASGIKVGLMGARMADFDKIS